MQDDFDTTRSLFNNSATTPIHSLTLIYLTDYIDNLERFMQDDFEPTEADVVMARIRTTGIVATNLEQRIANQVRLKCTL
jgi:hypothetical protein